MPSFVPILILGGVAFGFAAFTLVVSHILGRPRPNAGKSAVYECGVPAGERSEKERFPIKFYLVCMIFILLDVDAAFLYPWALIFKASAGHAGLGLFGFVEMVIFMVFLGGGFAYAWKAGALDW
jgi:NADH-quinone oxidoreductase subunit A